MRSLLHRDWKAVLHNLRKAKYENILTSFLRKLSSLNRKERLKVIEEEWDYLIVLDACRYDYFKEENTIGGKLHKKISPGSTSVEWLNNSFTDYYEDIYYVSANPFVSHLDSDTEFQRKPFIADDHFYDYDMVFLNEEFDEKGITRPEDLADFSLEKIDENPDKRFVVHFMQPHGPYIGEVGLTDEEMGIQKLRDEGFSWKEIREAYRSNLRRVLPVVEDMISELNGKVVVTADHGELLGEYGGLHSHPHGVHVPELVEVPWLEVDNESR